MRSPAVFLVTLLLLGSAFGQSPTMLSSPAGLAGNTGSIIGSARTPQGAPAADARVEVRDLQTGHMVGSAYVGKSGNFEISNLPMGRFEVVVTHGLSEGRERAEISTPNGNFVTIQVSGQDQVAAAGDHAVSVAQMRVPKKARKALEKANKAIRERQLEQAQEHLAKALELHPDFAEALTMRAVLRMDGRRFEEACQDLDKAIKADPSYSLAYVVLGAAYNSLERFNDAISTIDRGIALSPNSWQAYFELAKSKVGLKKYPEAVRLLDKAQSFGPQEFPLVHLVKAHALLGMENYADAMAELQAYLTQAPSGTEAQQAQKTLDQVKAFVAQKR